MKQVGILIQARMGSSRCPGKVLHPAAGQPLLGHLLDGLARCRTVQGLAIATSVAPVDDAIAAFCAKTGHTCFRGDLDDVAGRFLAALEHLPFDAAVRVCADSPLLDHRLVDHAVALFRDGDWDLVSNTVRRTFPVGQTVEVLDRAALARAWQRMDDPSDREHVTRHFYAHPGEYRIRSFAAPQDHSGLRMAVDTPEDRERIARLLEDLPQPHWTYGWEELAGMLAGPGGPA